MASLGTAQAAYCVRMVDSGQGLLHCRASTLETFLK